VIAALAPASGASLVLMSGSHWKPDLAANLSGILQSGSHSVLSVTVKTYMLRRHAVDEFAVQLINLCQFAFHDVLDFGRGKTLVNR
jgi:hypothetical protein